jgi:5-methylcytosine-specific restriction protein A
VPKPKNPDWTEDEHILALDLYLSKKPRQPQKGSPEVLALSALLNRLHQKLGTQGESTLRNPDGVYMKLMNLKAHDPEFVAKGRKGLQRGNRLELKVWEEYGNDQPRLKKVAAVIRSFIESDVPVSASDMVEEDTELAPEGRLLVRVHRSYERKPENRLKKLAAFRKANNGRIFCECCGFDFEATYGDRGVGFIECHHQLALSLLKPHQSPKLSDLRLLCSNCHRMIHVRQPWLTVEMLRALIPEPLGTP